MNLDSKANTMNPNKGLLSFMDLLDLDEEIIDSRLKSLMTRKTYTNEHLVSVINLLHYKQLINIQENTDCENEEEFEFVAKLIEQINSDNIGNVGKIIHTVLCLNKNTLLSKSEHLIQQIISSFSSSLNTMSFLDEETLSQTLMSLKLCDSILDAVSKSGEKISLLFFEVPLENVLLSTWEPLKIHFMVNTVPRLFENIIGYNILDRIWILIKKCSSDTERERALKTLSCLSEYFIPVSDSNGQIKFESEVIFQYEFWSLLLYGLKSNDAAVRKISTYLTKRAVDCVAALKKDVTVGESEAIFLWRRRDEKQLRQSWDNFFTLIDSLEEKQSNIVLPSIKLFNETKNVCKCWLHSAFKIGLKHDNTQVKLKCLEYRFKMQLRNLDEAETSLDALNDITLYENELDIEKLQNNVKCFMEDEDNFLKIFQVIPKIKWSPVPLYFLSKLLAQSKVKDLDKLLSNDVIDKVINDILKIPCNNIAIRKAVQNNISEFIDNCTEQDWRNIIKLHAALTVYGDKTLKKSITNPKIKAEEKDEFFNKVANTYLNVDFIIEFFTYHDDMVQPFLDIVKNKIDKLNNIVSRQYCDKSEGFNDFIFLSSLLNKATQKKSSSTEQIVSVLKKYYIVFLQYIQSLLPSGFTVNIEEIKVLLQEFDNLYIFEYNKELKDIIMNLNKMSLLLLSQNSDIIQKVISIYIINKYTFIFDPNNMNVVQNEHRLIQIIKGIELKEVNAESNSRLKNLFYEKSCEFIYNLTKFKSNSNKDYIQDIIDYAENAMESGGYGCLEWILKIIKNVLPVILKEEDLKFDINLFISRAWREIEELKSNSKYSPCMEEFVQLITQGSILSKPIYNNIVTSYCNKIIEYGPQKNTALYHLVTRLENLYITPDYGHIIYVLCEVLLYTPLPRKDQRILENLAVKLFCGEDYLIKQNASHFNFDIQYTAIRALYSNLEHREIYKLIVLFITQRIYDIFKSKKRYHENSQTHRILLLGLQHLLLISLLDEGSLVDERLLHWSEDLLGQLPHQASVRTCLEWIMALHYYVMKTPLAVILSSFKSKNIPMTSQFLILYWILKHKVLYKTSDDEEFSIVMDFFLSHTMGQMFNVRFHAQYLASKLYEIKKEAKYSYTLEIIHKTFAENDNEKSYVKLKNFKFFNDFDIISNLTPSFVYYFLPRYFNLFLNEVVDVRILKFIDELNCLTLEETVSDHEFKNEWVSMRQYHVGVEAYREVLFKELDKVDDEENEISGTIQKKYIPWKNMSDIEVYDAGRKKINKSNLIVVASLIDKVANLGGIARTSEVFAVGACVFNTLSLLQHSQFQALSVSAERWVNMEEVQPGAPLKSYLLQKKAEGFSVVAAEQTSASSQLQKFSFPKKTVLLLGDCRACGEYHETMEHILCECDVLATKRMGLLGRAYPAPEEYRFLPLSGIAALIDHVFKEHEKEGIPCDLLPLMDHCVEIPQQGVIRSLNVHVTAAIFIWVYTRQHVL